MPQVVGRQQVGLPTTFAEDVGVVAESFGFSIEGIGFT